MAGIQIAPRGDCHILGAAAAAGDALIDARAFCQIDHIMVEGNGFAFLFPADHILCQDLVLLFYDLDILRCQGHRIVSRANHRLHTQLCKAQICHMEYILGEIRILMGKSTAHIVALAPTGLYQFLELRHDLVVAALSAIVHTGGIVDLFSAVQAENNIAHFLIGKLDHIVVDQHTVGGKGKAEILTPLLFHTPGIGHQLLHHVPVHQRLAAKEVHFQIVPGAGIVHQKIQSLLAHFKGHQGSFAVVLALACKAVAAV